ncbi:MAG: MarR family transcriptional regulator [Bacteroidia bacterium]|jgi:DNA-binding MarR family transcriptional regulator|nr:MarR family transcriptional regulator [Bacteroidia bacterium]
MSSTNESSPENQYGQAAELLVNVSSKLIYTFNNALKPYQITSQQFAILKILNDVYPTPVTIKQIRSQMPDKMSDVSRIVEKMRLKGLVHRKINLDDRRNVDVSITSEGKEILSNSYSAYTGFESHMKSLSENEIVMLGLILKKLQ